jgi:hypothetical protein
MIPLTLGGALPLLLDGARPFWLSGLLRLILLVEEVDDGGSALPDWHAWNGILRYGRCVTAYPPMPTDTGSGKPMGGSGGKLIGGSAGKPIGRVAGNGSVFGYITPLIWKTWERRKRELA